MERSKPLYLSDTLNLILGALLFSAPWLFGFSDNTMAAWNAHIVGLLIVALSLIEMVAFMTWEEWVDGAIGIWLLAAPFAFGFNQDIAAFATHIAAGLLTVLFACWSLSDHSADLFNVR